MRRTCPWVGARENAEKEDVGSLVARGATRTVRVGNSARGRGARWGAADDGHWGRRRRARTRRRTQCVGSESSRLVVDAGARRLTPDRLASQLLVPLIVGLKASESKRVGEGHQIGFGIGRHASMSAITVTVTVPSAGRADALCNCPRASAECPSGERVPWAQGGCGEPKNF